MVQTANKCSKVAIFLVSQGLNGPGSGMTLNTQGNPIFLFFVRALNARSYFMTASNRKEFLQRVKILQDYNQKA